jgi:hypothetical protein
LLLAPLPGATSSGISLAKVVSSSGFLAIFKGGRERGYGLIEVAGAGAGQRPAGIVEMVEQQVKALVAIGHKFVLVAINPFLQEV